MKKIIAFVTILMFIFSCDKKEEKKETDTLLNNVKKDTITVAPIVTNKVIEDTLIFTVQIAALKKENTQLANLKGVQLFVEDGLTKYRMGSFNTYSEARKYRNQLRKTYKGAFVQALKNDAPISIQKALE
ncbi:SPOR domain-containing protein [Polaribacter sp.]|uniref:SPOR domain-containing protein n=1 Tax=Polaribacter sp. TaxID=1920175 RepID=UPI003F6A572A